MNRNASVGSLLERMRVCPAARDGMPALHAPSRCNFRDNAERSAQVEAAGASRRCSFGAYRVDLPRLQDRLLSGRERQLPLLQAVHQAGRQIS